MRRLRSQEGFVKVFLVLVILGGAIYAGSQFGMPYFRYAGFKHDVEDILRLELGGLDKTRTQVLASAENHHIPVEDKELIITATDKTVRVQTAWSVEVDIAGLYRKTLDFSLDVEQ